jgi:hypothetical protein
MTFTRRIGLPVLAISLGLAAPATRAADKPENILRTQFGGLAGLQAHPTLNQALAYFSEHHQLTLQVDDKAFRKLGVTELGSQLVECQPVGHVPVGFALQLILDTLRPDVTYKVQGDRVLIVPGKPVYKDEHRTSRYARLLTKPAPEYKDGLPETTLEKALTDLSQDGMFLPILIRHRPFGRDILAQKVTLPKLARATVGDVLRRLLRQADATYLVCNDYVLVVPAAGK